MVMRGAALLVLAMMAAGPSPAADDTRDAPRRLADALTRGTATSEDVAVITRWVLEAKDETVARGIRDALGSARPPGANDQRWSPVAGAMIGLFRSALADAETHRRRDVADWPELHALVKAAAPAVAESLREADPALRDQLLVMMGSALEGLREGRAGDPAVTPAPVPR